MVLLQLSKVLSLVTLTSDYSFLLFSFLYSNEFEVNFCKVWLSIICKQLEIHAKTISHLRLGDYKPIFTSPSALEYRLVITSPSATNC